MPGRDDNGRKLGGMTGFMDALRWILLIVGLVVIAGLYGYFRWKEGRLQLPSRNSWRRDTPPRSRRSERDVDVALRDLDDLVIDDPDMAAEPDMDLSISSEDGPFPVDWDDPQQTVSAPRVRPVTGQSRESRPSRTPTDEPKYAAGRELEADPAWQDAGEKLVVLHVTAGDGYVFTGPPLVDALERVGLQHGMHDIFHDIVDAHSGATPLYSVANMLEPGTFDLQTVDRLETPGVVFFLQLPGPFDGLTAFEKMLETARRLADLLGGQVLDQQRCDLTNQAVEHLREELREYRRRARLAAGNRH